MDQAGIERALLLASKVGAIGRPSIHHLPYELVADAVARYPQRFHGRAGIDPTDGMHGGSELERAVCGLGMIGAHCYAHWFELAPNHARYYPFDAECVELDMPF